MVYAVCPNLTCWATAQIILFSVSGNFNSCITYHHSLKISPHTEATHTCLKHKRISTMPHALTHFWVSCCSFKLAHGTRQTTSPLPSSPAHPCPRKPLAFLHWPPTSLGSSCPTHSSHLMSPAQMDTTSPVSSVTCHSFLGLSSSLTWGLH